VSEAEQSLKLVVSDTGFLLSVAATTQIYPVIKEMYGNRLAWPTDVLSELQGIDRRRRPDIPDGLAQRAIRCGESLFGDPITLGDGQRERADDIRARLGGTEPGRHAGESAGAILAIDTDGILLSEDLSAFPVLKNAGVRTADLRTMLFALVQKSHLTDGQITKTIAELNAKGRPNFEHLTAADVRRRSFLQT
jgi:hypothetical protein